MRQLAKFCKNCGAYIKDTDEICPDCGREIPRKIQKIKFCPNCGEKITAGEYFCKNCGFKLKEPRKEKTSFLDKHKTLIMAIAVITAIAIVSVGAFSMLTPTGYQEVTVDSFSFNIPVDFTENENLAENENEDGVIYASKYWDNEEDEISIDVMYAKSGNADAEGIASEMGGTRQSMMGHDGYYSELGDAYCFMFVNDNKLITVYVTDPNLFNEIDVL